jgi:putative DNA primase/helicase
MIPDLRGLNLTKRQRRRYEEMLQTYIGEEFVPADPPPPTPLRCFADLPEQPQEWLWPGRIPSGALTLLCGDQGRGKSLLTLDMAARVSAGLSWPHGGPPARPGDVLIFSAEDSLGRTVRNRLLAAGADLDRVHYIDTAHWSNAAYVPDDRPPSRVVKTPFGKIPRPCWDSLHRDVRHLRGALTALPECRLVIIDPFTAYLDQVDLYLDEPEEIRVALAPLTILADQSNAAIVAVVHRDGQQRLHSGQKRNGLRTLAGMARAAYLIDRVDANPHVSALIPVKNNFGSAATMAPFNVIAGTDGASQIEWSPEPLPLGLEHSDGAAPPLASTTPPRRETQIERAMKWLEQTLSDAGGSLLSCQLVDKAEEAGINPRCLRRAKKALGVISSNFGFVGGPWCCMLPSFHQKNQGGQENELADLAALANMADSQFLEEFPTIGPGESSTIPNANAA